MKVSSFIIVMFLVSSVLAAKKPAKMAAPAKIPPGQPEIFSLEPRGVQRGVPATIKLTGTNLSGLTELRMHNTNIQGALLDRPAPTTNQVWIQIAASTNVARGAYELSVKNTNHESSKLKIYVDDLPQVYQLSDNQPSAGSPPSPPSDERAGERRPLSKAAPWRPPFSFWGTLTSPGKADEIEIE